MNILKPDTDMDTQKAYTHIIEWLYLNDGNFPSAKEWRDALVKKLQAELGIVPDTEESSNTNLKS